MLDQACVSLGFGASEWRAGLSRRTAGIVRAGDHPPHVLCGAVSEQWTVPLLGPVLAPLHLASFLCGESYTADMGAQVLFACAG